MPAKINTSDLILDYKIHRIIDECDDAFVHIYTLVCRADSDTWKTTPQVDIEVVHDHGEIIWEYNQCLKTVQSYQAIKYPQVRQIKRQLRNEISQFRETVAKLHATPTKSK